MQHVDHFTTNHTCFAPIQHPLPPLNWTLLMMISLLFTVDCAYDGVWRVNYTQKKRRVKCKLKLMLFKTCIMHFLVEQRVLFVIFIMINCGYCFLLPLVHPTYHPVMHATCESWWPLLLACYSMQHDDTPIWRCEMYIPISHMEW